MGFTLLQLLAALAAPAGAVGLAIFNKREDLLGRAARLSAVAAEMPAGPGRSLVEELRDGSAIEWSLRAQAPRLVGLSAGAWFCFLTSGIAVTIWFAYAFIDGSLLWPWALYFVAVILAFIGQTSTVHRQRRRRAWMMQERKWRNLPTPVLESQKTISRSELRRLDRH
ncbi:hypothetical protein ABCS02_27890 [Microbacterium sp. X-17]|uniref:hypothetical protein n=1 Tax=Microbacterium sp. X-17 TaxID=3144404 RepID=UPI0031F48B61